MPPEKPGFFFFYSICSKSIVLGSNFQNENFYGFTRFEVSRAKKFMRLTTNRYVRVSVCYKHEFKRNFFVNSKFVDLCLYYM